MVHGSLGTKLKVLRAEQGLTLYEAAERIGVHRDTLSGIERANRRPVISTLAKIAKGYGVPVEALMSEEPAALPLTLAHMMQTDDEAAHQQALENATPEDLNRYVRAINSQIATVGRQMEFEVDPEIRKGSVRYIAHLERLFNEASDYMPLPEGATVAVEVDGQERVEVG